MFSHFIQQPSLPRQGIDPEDPEFGDQGLYFAIWKRHGRRMFRDLSISWDVTHCRYSWVPWSIFYGNHLLTMSCSYGLSLADGGDSMDELEQISKQIFMREGRVYDRWRQLYPALLHLYVTAAVIFTAGPTRLTAHVPHTATANQTTTSFGTILSTPTGQDGDLSSRSQNNTNGCG